MAFDEVVLIMMGLQSHFIDQVSFSSPPGFSTGLMSTDLGRTIMINNSSLQKWDRLAQKQLDQQFVNEVIHGLQCSPFEAKAVLEAVYKVYGPYFETSGHLKPGQILFQVISIDDWMLAQKILRSAKNRVSLAFASIALSVFVQKPSNKEACSL
jgi:hypothetical protein